MEPTLTLSLTALASLLPSAVLPFRRAPVRDVLFWLLLAVAIAGPLVWIVFAFAPGWRTGLASALWITVVASLVLFAGLSLWMREVWRLAPLLLGYLLLLAVMATIWQNRPEHALLESTPSAWVIFHIALSVVTYSLLTIGAIAGLAVTLRESALKAKRPTLLSRMLPSVADAEAIQIRLLIAGATILGCDLLSGMAAQFFLTGELLEFTHKVLFSLMTFVVIVILIAVHVRTGLRGRRAARLLLIAYLLITLAYPGVKFVTDVILS